MIKNNKHLYTISIVLFLILIALVVYMRFSEGGIWVGVIMAPFLFFLFITALFLLLLASTRNRRVKKGLAIRRPMNPMISIVAGIIIALFAKFIVSSGSYGFFTFSIYLIGLAVFAVGFFPLAKKIFSGKLER